MRPPPKFKTFLSECVTPPAYAAMEGHQPQWAYQAIERGLPVVLLHDGPGGKLIHVPTANEYHRSRLRSRGRKLKAV